MKVSEIITVLRPLAERLGLLTDQLWLENDTFLWTWILRYGAHRREVPYTFERDIYALVNELEKHLFDLKYTVALYQD